MRGLASIAGLALLGGVGFAHDPIRDQRPRRSHRKPSEAASIMLGMIEPRRLAPENPKPLSKRARRRLRGKRKAGRT